MSPEDYDGEVIEIVFALTRSPLFSLVGQRYADICSLKPFDAHCCHMDTAIKRPVPYRVKQSLFCNFWHPGTLTLSPERQSARMSKITNDGLTRSGTGRFIAVSI